MKIIDDITTTKSTDLRTCEEYRNWVIADLDYKPAKGADAELVLEREIDKPIKGYPSTLISIIKRDNSYTVYRTFGLGETGAVSVDLQNVSAEKVFTALLDKYSHKRQ